MARANGLDERFIDKTSTQRFLQEFGAEQKDQPLALSEELEVLKSAGLEHPTVLWLEYDEAVIVARKGRGEPARQGRPAP